MVFVVIVVVVQCCRQYCVCNVVLTILCNYATVTVAVVIVVISSQGVNEHLTILIAYCQFSVVISSPHLSSMVYAFANGSWVLLSWEWRFWRVN